jgi:hypothetical protein
MQRTRLLNGESSSRGKRQPILIFHFVGIAHSDGYFLTRPSCSGTAFIWNRVSCPPGTINLSLRTIRRLFLRTILWRSTEIRTLRTPLPTAILNSARTAKVGQGAIGSITTPLWLSKRRLQALTQKGSHSSLQAA